MCEHVKEQTHTLGVQMSNARDKHISSSITLRMAMALVTWQHFGGCLQDYPAVGRVTFFRVKRADIAEGDALPGASDWAADMIYTRSVAALPRVLASVPARSKLRKHLFAYLDFVSDVMYPLSYNLSCQAACALMFEQHK